MYLLPIHLLKGTGSFNGPQSGFGMLESALPAHVIEPNIGRNTKRLYIGGLPEDVEEEELVEFFNQEYDKKGLDKAPGNPALAALVNNEKHSALLEVIFMLNQFRSKDETTTALELDGIELKNHPLKVRRPKDYVAGEEDPHYIPGIELFRKVSYLQ